MPRLALNEIHNTGMYSQSARQPLKHILWYCLMGPLAQTMSYCFTGKYTSLVTHYHQLQQQTNYFFVKPLTNREELSFLMVLAFPKASSMGLAWRSWASSSPCSTLSPAFVIREVLAFLCNCFFLSPWPWWEAPATIARYWITFFVFSVFPAPDSPLRSARGDGCHTQERTMANPTVGRSGRHWPVGKVSKPLN